MLSSTSIEEFERSMPKKKDALPGRAMLCTNKNKPRDDVSKAGNLLPMRERPCTDTVEPMCAKSNNNMNIPQVAP